MVGHEERTLQRAARTWGTITAELYSNQLLKINEKLEDLRPYAGHSARKIILLHDNTRPHIASFTKNTIQKICW